MKRTCYTATSICLLIGALLLADSAGGSQLGGDLLGNEWTVTEGGITGRWVRRGNSETWDGNWANGAVAILTISIAGDKVRISRKDVGGPSAGLTGIYEGTLAPDGTVKGTETVTWSGHFTNMTLNWQGRIVMGTPPPQGDIGLNGCWSNCMVHIYQDRNGTLYFSSAWKNPPNCTNCDIKGWKLNRGKGQITGLDVHLYEIVAPTLLKDISGNYVTGLPLEAEYFLKLSADGNRLDGYWTSKGQRGNVSWTRDK
jgi:hypothetical protein